MNLHFQLLINWLILYLLKSVYSNIPAFVLFLIIIN